jgi:hypothetical protein
LVTERCSKRKGSPSSPQAYSEGRATAGSTTFRPRETHHPPWVALGQADQPLAAPFFRAYSGSGLAIHRLARSHRTPIRSKVARTVCALTRSSGLCPPRSSPRRPARASTGWCGLAELPGALVKYLAQGFGAALIEGGGPDLLRPRRALVQGFLETSLVKAFYDGERRLGVAAQRLGYLVGVLAPGALWSKIWQRRRTKASGERRPSPPGPRAQRPKADARR